MDPQSTGDILSEPSKEASTIQSSTETSHLRRNGFVGLMSSNTHRRDSGPQGLAQAKESINNMFDILLSDREYSSQQAIQARQAICLLEDRLNRSSTQQPESSVNSGGCLICGSSFKNRGVFTRHMKNQHYPQVIFHCPEPGCEVEQSRKDRIVVHMRIHGNELGPPRETEIPCPQNCPFCRITTNDWDEFYACIFSHHEAGGPRSENASSRRRSSDYSQGSQNGQAIPARSAQPDQSQWLTVPGTIPGTSSSFPSGNSNQSHQPPVRERSNSESRIASQPRLNPNTSSRTTPSTNGRSNRNTRRGVQRPGPPPRDRRPRPRGPSNRINRELRCTKCGHVFHECSRRACLFMTESKFGCHRCADRQSVRSPAIPLVTQDYQQPESYLDMNYMWHETLNPQYLETPRTIPQQSFLPGQFLAGQHDIANFNQEDPNTTTFRGNLTQRDNLNDTNVYMLQGIHSPTLSEKELLSPTSLGDKSPSSDLFTSTFPWELLSTRPKDMIPTIPSLWLYGKLRNAAHLAPSNVANSVSIDLEPSARKEAHLLPRPSQCQCACNKMANLSRGRRVEMSFSIANSPGTTLRNRIQVVVRLLSLRGESKKKAEAEAESKPALEQAVKPILGQAKTINRADEWATEEEDDDDDEEDEGYQSNTDSTPSRSSTPSPNHMLLYEDQPISPSYQPEREFSFDFELQPALRRISQWTGALAPDFGFLESSDSELECADSEQLFGYFFRYIVFMITVLGRAAADHNLGPRLRD